uniref:nuclear GTPase SLIP-GC-like isoform X2 n=1 Tax=Scatophagus argus TaxID=75038 RepID=UPI001ED80E3C|nr:nuclear GTPase SLIP-GC-like isoform X2 [Scatophagus argus]
MDEFVRNKLNEWRLSDWIQKFEDEGIDEESLYCLEEKDIDKLMPTMGPRARFKKNLLLLKKELNMSNQETADFPAQEEEAASSAQVWPSTSDTSNTGKRKSEVLDKNKWQSPTKRQRETKSESYTEKIILDDVKHIMKCVYKRLPNQDNKLNRFLKTKISDLETDKREMVGVFGKTGAGKSSLINAIIGENNLLPSGSISACTTVVIKVEANMQSQKYEGEIEFIKKEEWKDELWSLFNFLRDNAEQENDEDDDSDHDTVEKLTAVYGEEWRGKSPENLMENKYFREIPEFLTSKSKILTCESAEELSAKFIKYTRSDSGEGGGKEVKRWYWPLVKCVTVRVPNNDLLQHITLVDLPGNGDRNKSRDEMWKGVVGSCSTVWVVTEINRATAEREAWEILESACSIMGNAGECQYIHFICTKSDITGDFHDRSAADVRALIFKRNMQAKEQVKNQFRKLHKVKKHFNDDCFEVFTVSSKEFKKKKCLEPEDTEIPKLQKFLQSLNDCHSQTLNYVSGAYGILSLIQGSRRVAGRNADMRNELEKTICDELDKVRKPIEEAYEAFEKCLSEGVEKSLSSCEKVLKSTLYPPRTSGRGFHGRLKSLVKNGGIHKPKKGKQTNLNGRLASGLTDSVDEDFKKTFPNERNCGPFNGVIDTFSLGTESLIQKYKDAELQLVFLKTEEEKIKTNLNNIIRERKKAIYNSLTATVEEAMQDCYRTEAFRGPDTLRNMRDTIMGHVHHSKNTMFQQAKDIMLKKLRDLEVEILMTLGDTMFKSIELSLSTGGDSIPDFAVELDEVKKHYNNLKGNQDEETPLCIDLTADELPGPSASPHP